MKAISLKSAGLLIGAITVALLVAYGPVITAHPQLNFDDITVVAPMGKIDSLSDYIHKVKTAQILDLQPVRDLSFWIEYQIESVTDFRDPQLTNILIWIFALLGLRLLFLEAGLKDERFLLVLLLLAAVHPVASNSLAWASARKHVLSAFFTVWATFSWLRAVNHRQTGFAGLALVCFVLACLSQPINCGWWIWALYTLHISSRPRTKTPLFAAVGFMALFSAFVIVMNTIYYDSAAFKLTQMGGSDKIMTESFAQIGNRILILGRYLFQLTLPVRPSISPYDLGSWGSLIGLVLAIPLVLAVVQYPRKKEILGWLLFTLLPISVVTVRMTQHGGWDTYILTSLFGWMTIIGLLVKNQFAQKPQAMRVTGVILAVIFLEITFQQAQAWTSDRHLWEKAVATEPTPMSLGALGRLETQDGGDTRRATEIASRLLQRNPQSIDGHYILAKSIYNSEAASDEKDRLFKEQPSLLPWYQYFWAAHLAKTQRFGEGFTHLQELARQSPDLYILHFGDKVSAVTAQAYAMCVSARREDCLSFLTDIKSKIPPYRWNQKSFEDQLESHGIKAP